ncbi:unnamed protein product [Strongylus vulgaris]|uniref:Uncharacterized protein n=1 Tax=Strongylus vulgaris TaxID=40348 RepID=A0A3P7J7E1_STRVU|nr:unnamed protein product [Strongylus vulgaris]
MTCSLVGRDYICCEQLIGTRTASGSASTSEKAKRTKTQKTPYQALECPSNSIGLLGRDGLPLMCSTKQRCPGKAFCHSTSGRSICCESYEFASNILEASENNIRRSAEVRTPVKVLERTASSMSNTGNINSHFFLKLL